MRNKLSIFIAIFLILTIYVAAYLLRNEDGDKGWKVSYLRSIKYSNSVAVGGGMFYVASYKSGVHRSRDGIKWQNSSNGMKKCYVNAMAVDSKGRVYAATGRGVYCSTDTGENWTLRNNGLKDLGVRCVAVDSNDNVFIGTSEGRVYKSYDHAHRWIDTGIDYGSSVSEIAIGPSGKVYAVVVGYDRELVYISDLSRKNGPTAVNTKPHFYANSFAVDSKEKVYVANHKTILRSEDGSHWTDMPTGKFRKRSHHLAIGPSDEIIVATECGLLISKDHGKHWDIVHLRARTWFDIYGVNCQNIAVVAVDKTGSIIAISYAGAAFCGKI